MPLLENPKHELFAQEVAKGADYAAAYRSIYPRAGKASAEAAGSRLFGEVRDRVRELQEASASATVLSIRESREFLARVVRANLNALDMTKDGDLLQEITDTKDGRKIKLPGKRECIMSDAELSGQLIQRHEVKDTTPREPIEVLRERVRGAMHSHRRS